MTSVLYPAALAALLLAPLPTLASEGHDHGEAPPAAAGAALPRFTATSDDFELVGVLSGQHLMLYLDRTATNEPVTQARIELDVAGAKHQAEPHDGAFEVELAAEPKPGTLPITATVTVGSETDLLVGELDLHEDADEAAHAHSWREYAAWAAAALAGLTALTLIARRWRARRQGVSA